MFCYGNSKAISFLDNYIVFNFTGLSESYQQLHLLPPKQLGGNSEYEFDLNYFHYVIDNENVFMEFMKLILLLYEGKNIFLVISNDMWSLILIESLCKIIQQRYGINAIKIESAEDLYYAEESDFTDYGLFNLDQDKEKYLYLMQMKQRFNK